MTPPPRPQEWIISDKDYHIALEYFYLEARPYIQPEAPTEIIIAAFKAGKYFMKDLESRGF